MIVETFETACTWDRFPALHAAVTAAAQEAARAVCGAAVVTCRFTHVYPDGPAPYFSIYAPGRWGSLVESVGRDQGERLARDLATAAPSPTTTPSAATTDPGTTAATRPLRRRPVRGEAALDPAGVLNPGVLLDADRRGRLEA